MSLSGQRCPWKETPRDKDLLGRNPLDRDLLCRSPLDRDPLDRDPLDRDPLDRDSSPRQRSPCTETPWIETPLIETPWIEIPRTVTNGRYASYWNAYLFDCFIFGTTVKLSLKTQMTTDTQLVLSLLFQSSNFPCLQTLR